MRKWFSLGSDGRMHFVGNHADWETADEACEKALPEDTDSIWLFDEMTARNWTGDLVRMITMNHILSISDFEVTDESTAVFTIEDVAVWLQRVDDRLFVDLFLPNDEEYPYDSASAICKKKPTKTLLRLVE